MKISSEQRLPDLSFPTLDYTEKEALQDLRCCLYQGGAATNIKDVDRCIGNGQLGSPILERLELVIKVHEHLTYKLAGGGTRRTLLANISSFRTFVSYVDKTGRSLNLSTAVQRYLEWTDHYWQRVRMNDGVTEAGAYQSAVRAGALLDVALERSRPLVAQTRLRAKSNRTAPTSKQDLEATFKFGHMLQDLCTALTLDAVRGSLPIRIMFRTGHLIEKWCGLSGTQDKSKKEVRDAHNRDTSLKSRSRVINLRIEAELLMFIAQTGINLTQAIEAKLGDFSYTSHTDGYRVRRRKNRRNGEVEFEIFKEYRPHFESYLAWRRALFPDGHNTRLFPFITATKTRGRTIKQIGEICEVLQVRFYRPQILRKTRINFLLRESNDVEITAEMAQHSKEVLLRHYVQPNHQIAIVEIHRFHQKNDPSIASPGPGSCLSRSPEQFEHTPRNAPQPNCVNPSGCLFCVMHRDVDSQNYVWSLASLRHLKALESSMSKQVPNNKGTVIQPADLVVNRITQKLKLFETYSLVRKEWVNESLERVAEGHHHPMWNGFIQIRELGL